MKENTKIIGYDRVEEGFSPIYEPGHGMIVTQAFILCSDCGSVVYHCMGPRYKAICLDCHKEETED